MIRTDIITTATVDDKMYILDNTPYQITAETSGVSVVYVPEFSYEGYTALNSDLANKLRPYSYTGVQLTKQPFYDEIAVIMTSESNAPMMSVMYSKGLCANADYMTLAEAKAVQNSDVVQLLDGNESVTHFEEFQYFTNVTDAGQYFARGTVNLESIILPKSLKTIPPRMFTITKALWNAGKRGHLKYVGNTEQIERVGEVAFQYQRNIKSLNFTQKLKTIDHSGFIESNYETNGKYSEGGLYETFGDLSGVETVGRAAFWTCNHIKSIYMPKVTYIDAHTFDVCEQLSDITLDWDNLTNIGEGAFIKCNLRQLPNMPKITTIDRQAFYTNISLESVGDMPLLTTLGQYAFWHNLKLNEVGDMPLLTTITNYAFADDLNLVKVGKLDSLTTINEGGFAGCNKLPYIYLPVANNVGKYAFAVDEGLGVNRTIEFGLPYESITFNNQAFVNNVNTRIICNGVELTAEQYEAVGAQKPQ